VNQPNPRGGEAAVMRVNPTLQHTARKDGTELWYGILGAECGGDTQGGTATPVMDLKGSVHDFSRAPE